MGRVVTNYPVGGVCDLMSSCLREVGRLEVGDFSREGCAKATQTFLISLAQNCPSQVYPALSYVAPHMDGAASWVCSNKGP